jgi:hypothetical protein
MFAAPKVTTRPFVISTVPPFLISRFWPVDRRWEGAGSVPARQSTNDQWTVYGFTSSSGLTGSWYTRTPVAL